MNLDRFSNGLVMFFSFLLIEEVTSQECRSCSVSVFRRRICQRVAANASAIECSNAGCCYDDADYFSLFYRVPAHKCYEASIAACPTFTCDVSQDSRERCGDTIFAFTCRLAGCCFDGTLSPNCYRSQRFNRSSRIFSQTISTTAATTTTIATTRPPTTTRRPAFWSRWSVWSSCSESCTRGVRTRRRICVSRSQEVSITFCNGQNVTSQTCNTQLCQRWGNWTEYGICSAPCNQTGIVRISRNCEDLKSPGPTACRLSVRPCTNVDCQPKWASWLSWSACSSAPCQPGTRVRYRQCMLNGVTINVRRCIIAERRTADSITQQQTGVMEIDVCKPYMCDSWESWSAFGECQCARANTVPTRRSTRACINKQQEPQSDRDRNEFEACAVRRTSCFRQQCVEVVTTAATTEALTTADATTILTTIETDATTADEFKETTKSITTSIQPVSTTTSAKEEVTKLWSQWSSCSQSCGRGSQRKVQICANENGTRVLSTAECNIRVREQRRDCNMNYCLQWTEWVEDECSVNCEDANTGFGFRQRSRACINGSQETVPVDCFVELLPCFSPSFCTTSLATRVDLTEAVLVNTSPTTNSFAATPVFPSESTSETVVSSITSSSTVSTLDVSRQSSTLSPVASSTSTSSTAGDRTTSTASLQKTSPPKGTLPMITGSSVPSIPPITWNGWGEWNACSETCGIGTRTRTRFCSVSGQCDGEGTRTESCNEDFCKEWSQWSATCTEKCGGGRRVMERGCADGAVKGASTCYRLLLPETCNTEPCDRNLDILFLVDSSDYVDNCRTLRRNYSIPLSSELINEQLTPVYDKIKQFMTRFMEDWKFVDNERTRIGIQLISKACSANTGKNLNVQKHLNENHDDFTSTYVTIAGFSAINVLFQERIVVLQNSLFFKNGFMYVLYIESLSYECGSFFVDLALTCAERNIFTLPSGDRENNPNVIVALVSRVPSYIQPSNFLLSSISRRMKQAGITILTAGVTPLSGLSRASSRQQYEEMLRTISCQNEEDCPAYLGSIWEDNLGGPAERIRTALQYMNII